MLKRAVDRAVDNLESARTDLKGFSAKSSYRTARDSWCNILVKSHRIFTLLEQGAKVTDASKNWFGRHKHTRRTDPLLQYVHHARNADEHGIEAVTQFAQAKIELVAGETTRGTIENVTNFGGSLRGTFRPGVGASSDLKDLTELRIYPDRPVLIPVVDRGMTYLPPVEHLGQALPDAHPHVVAKLMLTYLEQMIGEAGNLAVER